MTSKWFCLVDEYRGEKGKEEKDKIENGLDVKMNLLLC
jgi:hypothetical protein